MSPIENLVTEILGEICDHLTESGAKPGGLASFSLACKRLASVGRRYRLSRICFRVTSQEALATQVAEVQDALGSELELVREIIISSSLYERIEFNHRQRRTPATYARPDDGVELCGDVDRNTGPLHVPRAFNSMLFGRPRVMPVRVATMALAKACQPLTELMCRLPNLNDIVWASSNHVPPSILAVLEDCPSKPQFHLHSFEGGEAELINHWLDISKYISSLSFSIEPSVYANHYPKVWKLLSLPTINLKSICVWGWPYCNHEPDLWVRALVPFERTIDWRKIMAENSERQVEKTLDTLVTFSPSQLLAWSYCVRLEKLRDLSFTHQIQAETLREFTGIIKETTPWDLEALRIRLQITTAYSEDMNEAISELLGALRGLETLELVGSVGESALTSILSKHGPTLKRLRFQPLFESGNDQLQPEPHHFHLTASNILTIAQSCPQLSSLDILLSNGLGDEGKIEACLALAEVRRLRHVCLEMEFWGFGAPVPRSTQMEKYMYEETPGQRVLAGVTARSKARAAIFDAISGALGQLEHLHIHVWGNCRIPLLLHEEMLWPHWVGYTWVCDRRFAGGSVYTQEIEKRKKLFCPSMPDMRESSLAADVRETLVEAVEKIGCGVQQRLLDRQRQLEES